MNDSEWVLMPTPGTRSEGPFVPPLPLNHRFGVESEYLLYAPFEKIDGERREVFGYATTPTRDQAGESVDLDAVRKALPKYLQYPAVREMHQPSAVGTGIEASIDDRGLWFGAKVVDDQAWRKVQANVYRGFSVGGKVTKRDPKDPRRILGIDLVEVSLVDRPCNPDAKFELIKRDQSGHLQMTEGFEKASPYVNGHGHVTSNGNGIKARCGGPALCPDCKQEWKVKYGASYPDKVEGFQKAGRVKSGRFASVKQLHGEATEEHIKHSALADEAEKDAERHQRKAESAVDAKDKAAMALHSAMSHTSAAVAAHHRDIASRYKDIATRLIPEGSEDDMPDSDLEKILREADAAMDALGKSVGGESGSGKNPDIDTAYKALEHGQQMDAKTIASIASATRSRANAAASRVSEPEKAKHQTAEAAASETSAHEASISARDDYKTFEHYLKTGAGTSMSRDATGSGKTVETSNVEGTKLAEHNLMKAARKWAKSRADHVAALRKAGDEYIGMAKKEGTPEDEAKEMEGTAANLKKEADEHEKFAILKGVIEDKFKDLAGTENSSGGEIVAKVKKSSKLIKIGSSWVDKDGNWFGKRDFSDDKRKELAGSGAAMPDGSFPIEDKADLENAVQAHGRAKDPDKAKAHIKSRAKALGATGVLPAEWKKRKDGESAEDKEDKAIGMLQDAQAKEKKEGTGDDDKKNAGDFGGKKAPPFTGKSKKNDENDDNDDDENDDDDDKDKLEKSCAKCGGMMKAGDMKCAGCGAELRKSSPRKDMEVTADLANVLGGVQRLAKSVRTPNVAELSKWLADGNKLLQAALAEKITSMMKDAEISEKVFAKAAPTSDWMKTAAGALVVPVDGLSPIQRDTRIELAKSFKKMRRHLKKVAKRAKEAANAQNVADLEKRLSEKLAKVAPTGVGAIDALQKIVARVAPLAKAAQEQGQKLTAANAEITTLKERLAKLEEQPADNGGGKTKLAKGVRPFTKEDDQRQRTDAPFSEVPSKFLEGILSIPPGPARQQAILRSAYTKD